MKPVAHASRTGGVKRVIRRFRGFTLVEILIAIGILGLVLTAIYSSWTAILRARKVGLDTAAAAQRSRITVRVLEDSLTSAQSFVQNQRFYSFVAENSDQASLSFVARLAKSFPRSGKFGDLDVRRVTFTVEPGSDGAPALVLRQNPLLMEMDDDEKEHPLVLAHDVKEFSFEFWDNRLNDWIDEWKQTNQLPKGVRITLKLGGNARGKPLEEIMLPVTLPGIAVQPGWQMSGAQVPPQNPGGLQPIPNTPNPNFPPGQQQPFQPRQPLQPFQPGQPQVPR